MEIRTRKQQFETLFPDEKPFRWRQIEQAIFATPEKSWNDLTMLSKSMREILENEIPWMSIVEKRLLKNPKGDTYKAALETVDGHLLEAVLMKNARNHWTLCLSSQIGCAMNCSFCATGKMGFTRNLTDDEIIDQYRYWQAFLRKSQSAELGTQNNQHRSPTRGVARLDEVQGKREERSKTYVIHTSSSTGTLDAEIRQYREPDQSEITNIVIMGMGEPMANYEHMREALTKILQYTPIGETRITVSSVGILPQLEKILDDPLWPPVRLAISLHSADRETRKNIVPTSYDDFLEKLANWSRKYLTKFGNRRHHLTFEHILLSGVNDTTSDAKKLASFVRSIDIQNVRVNLIPYNETHRNNYATSADESAEIFLQELNKRGISATIRRSKGLDIAAACGQLATEEE